MKAERLLFLAHWAMSICLLLSLLIVFLVYGSNTELSIRLLVALHIGLIIFPGIFKVAYVTRLTALKQLGRAVN